MNAKAGYSTPLLHVADIEKSIEFYERLGFTIIDTDRTRPLGWARLHCEGGAVMFLRAEEPVDASVQSVLLYMYTPDLVALRERLLASGVKVPAINRPEYMPSGEICIADPDGYTILVGHWGKSEQEAWEKRIGTKALEALSALRAS
ncbi:MAG: VOC family protein [Acidobacteriales bacterium]|nr:VOC family protein [Terriglobales bacterium]